MPRRWSSMEEFEDFLNAGGIVEVDDDFPDVYRASVFGFIEHHANSELIGALTERDLAPRAPGLRHKLAALAKTQDELGHAHLLYMVAADLALKTRREMLDDLFAGKTRFSDVFNRQVKTWGDQVAIALLVDGAALISQRSVFTNCSYGPYKRALKRIVREETIHARLGEEQLARISNGTAKQRAMFQRSIDDWWSAALQLFGRDSRDDDLLLRWHIKSARNEVLRERWVQRFVPMLRNEGFSIPDADLLFDESDGRWVIGPIDWEAVISTTQDGGPDSARRIGDAAGMWQRTSWVRRAMDRPLTSQPALVN